MSNRVRLNAVKIEYLNGNVTYGYTISDDYALSFDNNSETMIEDDIELLTYALKTADDTTDSMFDFIRESEKGILINDNGYDWDEIKKYMTSVSKEQDKQS